MKNSFGMLEDVVKRKIKEDERDVIIETKARDIRGYTYIPNTVFQDMLEFKEYDYLKNGLYVMNNHLKARPSLKKIIKVHHGDYNYGKVIEDVSWHVGRFTTQDLGMKMATIPEFLRIHDYVMKNDIQPLTKNFKKMKHAEFLETVLYKGKDLFTHMKPNDEHVMVKVDPTSNDDELCYFDINDTDVQTGIPYETGSKGDYYFECWNSDKWKYGMWFNDEITTIALTCQEDVMMNFEKVTAIRPVRKVKKKDLMS